jgi:hypothetical protein
LNRPTPQTFKISTIVNYYVIELLTFTFILRNLLYDL